MTRRRGEGEVGALLFLGLLVVIVLFGAMWGMPRYKVYSSEMAGQAELKQAEYNRQIKVREAEATNAAAKSLADAEIERARGVAEANKIIGTSLKNNEAYLRYLYIQALEGKQGEVIYVPTEAGLPILEANRLNQNRNLANVPANPQ